MAAEEIGARLDLKGRREFSRDAKRAADDVERIGTTAKRANGGLGLLTKGFGALRSAAKVGVVALGAAGAAATAAGIKFVGLAMDAGETQSKFNTVFKGMEADVNSFIETTNQQFGIPTKELQDAASTFGVFAKAADVPQKELANFSTSLTQAGLDLASFYNAEPGDVFLALRSGLAGEAEPLRKFGIFLSDATLKAQAAQMGLTGELTEAQKVMVRHQIIMANLGDAQGDLARTQGSLANQTRGLRGRLTEAGTAIGAAFLPYAEELTQHLNNRLQPIVLWLQERFPVWVERGADAMGGLVRTGRELWGVFDRNGLEAFVSSADEATLGTGQLWNVFTKLRDIGLDVVTIVRDALIPAWKDISSATPDLLQPLTSLDDILGFIADNAKTLRTVVKALVAAYVLYRATTWTLIAVDKAHAAVKWVNIVRDKEAIKLTMGQRVAKLALAGVTKALAAAQWLLNAAMSANPIMLVVIAIGLLVAGFVIAWKKSETFRNIVTGAFNAVKNFAMDAFGWVKANWPLLLGILTGPIGGAVYVIVRNWDTIKKAAKGALNWIIDKVNKAIRGINVLIRGFNRLPGPDIGEIGQIPKLHQGGWTPTGGAVNMRPGEEIVILPPAASVVPQPVGTIPTTAPGGAPQPLVVYVQMDRRTVGKAVIDDIRDVAARR